MLVDGPGDEEIVSAVVGRQQREASRKVHSPPAYNVTINQEGRSRAAGKTSRVGNSEKRTRKT